MNEGDCSHPPIIISQWSTFLILAYTRHPLKMDINPPKIFIIYARTDEPYKQQILMHLRPLIDGGRVEVWHDGDIKPGEDWEKAIKKELAASDLVLILVSVHMLSSEFIRTKELGTALARLDAGLARVVPVVVSPCVWDMNPVISRLQALPQAGAEGLRPVNEWENTDSAWVIVVKQIGEIAQEIQDKRVEADRQKAEQERLRLEQNRRAQEKKQRREADEKEKSVWQQAANQDSIIHYEGYLAKYPNGMFANKAQTRRKQLRLQQAKQLKTEAKKEKNDWEKTLNKDAIPAFENYLKKYPKGSFIQKAKKRIAELKEEENVWEKVLKRNSIKDLNDFLATYPNSIYAEEAFEKIEKIERNRALVKNRTEKDSIEEPLRTNDRSNKLKFLTFLQFCIPWILVIISISYNDDWYTMRSRIELILIWILFSLISIFNGIFLLINETRGWTFWKTYWLTTILLNLLIVIITFVDWHSTRTQGVAAGSLAVLIIFQIGIFEKRPNRR